MDAGTLGAAGEELMIYHLVEQEIWEARRRQAHIAVPGPEGFVHCCDDRQIRAVRSGYFPADARVLALALDPTQLAAETRYEPGSRGEHERFPHVFGPIASAAVKRVITV